MIGQASGQPQLIAALVAAIRSAPDKSISFRDYMDLVLYHPEFGYYMADRPKIGTQGDFYTSSQIGSIMGEMLAHAFVRRSEDLDGKLRIVEWGAGSGRLARQILDEISSRFPQHYDNLTYTLIDASAFHRKMQSETLSGHIRKIAQMTGDEWFAQGPYENVIVFSNELIDAFPVHRIRKRQGQMMEVFVAWDMEQAAFYETLHPLSKQLEAFLARNPADLREQQEAEVNTAAEAWLTRTAKTIKSGILLTIDYGDTREELYAAHRMKGTLMCYRNHTANDNPYRFVGEQDITAHVNFSSLIAAGEMLGFKEWSLLTQKRFLISEGILDKLQSHAALDPFDPAAKKNRAIRQLLLSDQMSELFKVLEQRKKVEER